MSSKFSGARWTLRERFTLAGISQLQALGRGLDGETVEVMPVSEHTQNCDRHERFVEDLILDQENLRTAALTLTESCERLRFDTNQGYLGESVRALRAILNNKEEQR